MERFSILFRRQWFENQKTFWFATLVLLGIIALLYAYNIFSSSYLRFDAHDPSAFARFSSLSFRTSIVIIVVMFYLCIFSGQYFSAFGKPITAIQEITLPVSAFERTVCAVILSTLMLLATSVLVCLVVDTVFVSGLRMFFEEELTTFHSSAYVSYDNTAPFLYITQALPIKIWQMLLVGLMLSSCFTLGSIYFTRLAFLKTSMYLLLLFGLGTVMEIISKRIIWADRIRVSSSNFDEHILFGIVAMITIVCWIGIYHRLKEKEI